MRMGKQQVLPATFHDFSLGRVWRAKWIVPPVREQGGGRYLFRCEFSLQDAEALVLHITAGRDYELFVNGRRVAYGPPPSQPHWKYYDEIPLSGFLCAGVNCVGAVVHAEAGGDDDGEPAGLLAELVDADGGLRLQTDAGWRVTGHNGWRTNEEQPFGNRQEMFDARVHPRGWNVAGYADDGWSRPDVLDRYGAPTAAGRRPRPIPWTRLVPRGIPLLEETYVLPQAVVAVEEGQDILSRGREEWLAVQLSAAGQPIRHAAAEGVEALLRPGGAARFRCSLDHLRDKTCDGIWCPSVVLDFGKVYSGFFEIELEGAAGAVVEMGYVERLLNGHFNNALEVFYADRYVMRAGRHIFRCAIWKSFRYVKLRFVKCFEPVTVHSARTVACGYPFKELGRFETSDATLTGVFEMSRHTLRLCSRDYFMDSPWREKRQWTGDVSAVTLGGVYACFGDTALPGKFLRQAMVNQSPQGLIANSFDGFSSSSRIVNERLIPDYSLWWIQALWQHYIYTGEERYIHEGYAAVCRIMQFHFHYLNGWGLLADMPGWVFIDHVFQCEADELAVYNALFYGTLECAAKMAELKGDRWMRDKVNTLRPILAANFHARFFDAQTGVYLDGRNHGEPVRSISEHANMAAILWDLCPEHVRNEVVDRFYGQKSVDYLGAEPFFTSVVLRALAHCGRMDTALDILRERWGRRMLDAGLTSTSEEWNASGSRRGANHAYLGIFRSLSHAWSACPAEFLTKNLVGLEILEPGCAKVRLRPAKTAFDYTVAYPVPQGLIEVSCRSGRIDVRAPVSVHAEVAADSLLLKKQNQ